MTRKPTVSSRVDDGLHESIQEYCEEHDVSQSVAIQRFIEIGLAKESGDNDVERWSELCESWGIEHEPEYPSVTITIKERIKNVLR